MLLLHSGQKRFMKGKMVIKNKITKEKGLIIFLYKTKLTVFVGNYLVKIEITGRILEIKHKTN